MDPRDTAYVDHVAQGQDEKRGEELRLAYVALTRAKHQAVIWWATTHNSRDSALGRLVFGSPAPARRSDPESGAAATRERFVALAAAAPDSIVLERALIAHGARFSPQVLRAADLEAAEFDRSLDPLWRRMSYSSVTAGAYEARVASEIEEATGADDAPDHHPLAVADTIGDEAALLAVPSLLSDMPAGTRVGTLLHQVLEETDFGAADLNDELSSRIADARRGRSVDVGDPIALIGGLREAIETPLGPLVGDRRLRDIAPGDRLTELTFELPLVS